MNVNQIIALIAIVLLLSSVSIPVTYGQLHIPNDGVTKSSFSGLLDDQDSNPITTPKQYKIDLHDSVTASLNGDPTTNFF